MTAARLQRTIPAPPAAVYRAWLDPALLTRWSAPVGWDNTRAEVDERVGGHYRAWHVRDGEDLGGYEAEILELVPDERIVFSWHFVGPDRTPVGDPSRLTVTFRPAGPDATELTLVHERLTFPDPASVDAGWTGTLGRLAELFANE